MTAGAGAPVGVLPVDKPEGPTSHDLVRQARRIFRTRRVGHTGTLDPFASGLLLLCTGWATRLVEYLTGLDKVYRAVARLGVVTDTADRTGAVVREDEGWRTLRPDEIEHVFETQLGEIAQYPPAYSAKKVGGVRAYERARRGEEFELEAVRVRIDRIEILELDLPDITFEVACSSGTYIRSIARDIGEILGVGAHLTWLRRTRIGPHDISRAIPASRMDDPEAVREAWLTPLEAVSHLPRVAVEEREATALKHGVRIPAPGPVPKGEPLAITFDGELLAIGSSKDDSIQARKVFAVD